MAGQQGRTGNEMRLGSSPGHCYGKVRPGRACSNCRMGRPNPITSTSKMHNTTRAMDFLKIGERGARRAQCKLRQ